MGKEVERTTSPEALVVLPQFFVGLGYSHERWTVLATDLQQHAQDGIAQEGAASP